MLGRWSRVRLGILIAVGVVVAAGGLVQTGTAASAQTDQECWTWVRVVTGYDQNGDPQYGYEFRNQCQSSGGDGSDGGSTICEGPDGDPIDCYDDEMGWWSNAEKCYVRLVSPQPPAGDWRWQGNDPEEGSLYIFSCPVGGDFRENFEFREQGPDVPSVAELAQQAMQSLPLAEPEIGIAPDPDGVGLVGVYVWLWIDNADAAWGPVSVSVPGPGFTVTARGEVAQIEWDMGDRSPTEICDSPGEPYQASYGAQKPECGHVYNYPSSTQPDGRYHITVTTVWDVSWWVEPDTGEGGGEAFERQATTSVQINELQVVTS